MWGHARRDQVIHVNGKRFWIRPNLFDALSAVYYNSNGPSVENPAVRSSIPSVYVWIDAICINQENEREKAQQVALVSLKPP